MFPRSSRPARTPRSLAGPGCRSHTARPTHGDGWSRRAAELSAWVFDNLAADRIEIHAEPDNAASRLVAERVGFTFEGVLRSYIVNKGVRRDAASYSLLRGELR